MKKYLLGLIFLSVFVFVFINYVKADEQSGSESAMCVKLSHKFNVKQKNCSETLYKDLSMNTNFDQKTPQLVLTNGMRLFFEQSNGDENSEYFGIYDDLKSNAANSNQNVADYQAVVVFIDVNGTSGTGKLGKDVYKYYLTRSKKTIVVPIDIPENNPNKLIQLADDNEYLSFNVMYDDYNDTNARGRRVVKFLKTNISFREAACISGYVDAGAPYCTAKGYVKDSKCVVESADCRMQERKPSKTF